jgi:uncharacterized phage infection (PIP) family protein YhgE
MSEEGKTEKVVDPGDGDESKDQDEREGLHVLKGTKSEVEMTDEEEFDKERAMATIKKLRGFEKDNKALKKQLSTYEAAKKKRQEEEMSELEKAQKLLAEEKQSREELETNFTSSNIQHAVELTAAKMDFQNPEDAYRLADLSEVEITDEGKVEGVEKALKDLAKSRPYLIKGKSKAPDIDAKSGGGKTKVDDEAIARRFGL